MLVCCCRVLLVLCALFWRGGRVFPFSFPFVVLCLPLSFLSSLVGACACASLLCLYSQGYFCSPLTPAKKKPLWTGRFLCPMPSRMLVFFGCLPATAAASFGDGTRGVDLPAGWLWSVAAGPDCSTHPPPWRLRHLFPRIRIYHFVACFFSRMTPFHGRVACHVFHPPCSFLRVLFAVAFLLRSWEHRWVRSMYVWWGRFLTRPG